MKLKLFNRKRIFLFFAALFSILTSNSGVFSKESSGIELPEVTVMGKDISDYEAADSFKDEISKGEKETILFSEMPGIAAHQKLPGG